MNLSEYKTHELVEELSKREGITIRNLKLYEKNEFDFDEDEVGEMIILKITK